MPIAKYPIHHRFGVIANNKKIQLQEQLLQDLASQNTQDYLQNVNRNDLNELLENPEFDDKELINIFNHLDGPIEKCEFLVKKAQKIFNNMKDTETKILEAERVSEMSSRASSAAKNNNNNHNLKSNRKSSAVSSKSNTSTEISSLSRPHSQMSKSSVHEASMEPQNSVENAQISEEKIKIELNSQQQNLTNLQNQLQKQEKSIQKYNKYIESSIERARRRCGLSTEAKGNHVNLTVAWTELTILSKIDNPTLKKTALEILCKSLSQSDLTQDRIVFTGRLQSLVFIGQSILFWLHWLNAETQENETGNSQISSLTMAEYLGIRIIYFIFIRLWCYATLGILTYDRHSEQINDLMKYLSVLDKTLQMYRFYPDAAYCLKVILEISDELERIIPDEEQKQRVLENSQLSQLSTSLSEVNLNKSEAVIMDEILLNEVSVNAKLIRDITPALYQAIDLYRRKNYDLSDYDFEIFQKSFMQRFDPNLIANKTKNNNALLDRLFTLGILSVLSTDNFSALDILQHFSSNNYLDNYDWCENYLIGQLQNNVCLFGKNSEIRRNCLVGGRRSTDEVLEKKLVEQSWRPKYYEQNLGSLVDFLSYYSKRRYDWGQQQQEHHKEGKTTGPHTANPPNSFTTHWIIHATTISNMIKTAPQFQKSDPLKPAISNLIQAHTNMEYLPSISKNPRMVDEKIFETINFSKAITEETKIHINELTIWEKCADLFSECLLPNMSLTKSLKECKITESKIDMGGSVGDRSKKLSEKKGKGGAVKKSAKLPKAPRTSAKTIIRKPNSKNSKKDNEIRLESSFERGNQKMEEMVQSVWERDLYAALEKEIDSEM